MINRLTITPQTDLMKLSQADRELVQKGLATAAEVTNDASQLLSQDNVDGVDLDPKKGSVKTQVTSGDVFTEQTLTLKESSGNQASQNDVTDYKKYSVNSKKGEIGFASLERGAEFDANNDGKMETGMLIAKATAKATEESMVTKVFYNNDCTITIIEEPLVNNM